MSATATLGRADHHMPPVPEDGRVRTSALPLLSYPSAWRSTSTEAPAEHGQTAAAELQRHCRAAREPAVPGLRASHRPAGRVVQVVPLARESREALTGGRPRCSATEAACVVLWLMCGATQVSAD